MSNTTITSMADSPPAGETINLIDPYYEGYKLVITLIILSCVSFAFTILRLYTRKTVARALGKDDYFLISAWIFVVIYSIACSLQTRYGLGRNVWNVTTKEYNTFLKLQIFLGITYLMSLALAKVAIAFLYLRLSPDRTFRLLVFGCMGFVVAYTIAGVICMVFACSPIEAAWDTALHMLATTKCLNWPLSYLAQAAFNIATDIALFILPVKTVWRLQLPIQQRLGVICMFASGLLVVIISIVRVRWIIQLLSTDDLTMDSHHLALWSGIEAHFTIICGCIPALKPLMSILFPSVFGYYPAEIERLHGGGGHHSDRYLTSQTHTRDTSTHKKLGSSSSSPTGYGSTPKEHRRSSTMLLDTSGNDAGYAFPFPNMKKMQEGNTKTHSPSTSESPPAAKSFLPFHTKSTKTQAYNPLHTSTSPATEEKYQMSTYPTPLGLDPIELGESKTFVTATNVCGGQAEVDEEVREAIAEAGGMGKNVIFVTRTMKVERGERGEVGRNEDLNAPDFS